MKDSVNNCLQYSIAKHNLEITYYEVIAQVACKKLIRRVVKKKRSLQSKKSLQKLQKSGN